MLHGILKEVGWETVTADMDDSYLEPMYVKDEDCPLDKREAVFETPGGKFHVTQMRSPILPDGIYNEVTVTKPRSLGIDDKHFAWFSWETKLATSDSGIATELKKEIEILEEELKNA
jgi:hypothetical protein